MQTCNDDNQEINDEWGWSSSRAYRVVHSSTAECKEGDETWEIEKQGW